MSRKPHTANYWWRRCLKTKGIRRMIDSHDLCSSDSFDCATLHHSHRVHKRQLMYARRRKLGWLDSLYSLVAQRREEAAIDLLFKKVDELLSDGQFAVCDNLLRIIDLARLDTNLLVGVLSITLSAADKLDARSDLVARVAVRLGEIVPDRVDRLLTGLR